MMRAMGQNPTEDEVFFHDSGHDDDGDQSDLGDDYDGDNHGYHDELGVDGPESNRG